MVRKTSKVQLQEWFDPAKFRAARLRRGLTQQDLAERMGWKKVPGGNCLSRYENAPFRKSKQLPSLDTVHLMAGALDVDVGDLLSSREQLVESIRLLIADRNSRTKGSRGVRQRKMFADIINELADELE